MARPKARSRSIPPAIFLLAVTACGLLHDGAGLVTVNVTAGQIHAGNAGIQAIASDTGGILINMTGGQIGTAAQRVGQNGIAAFVTGTAGDLTITSTAIFANNDDGIFAQIDDNAATGDLAVTTNGTTSSLLGNGITVDNNGTGTTTVTVNAPSPATLGSTTAAG